MRNRFIRTSLVLAGLLVAATTARADYVVVRININQLNFFPPMLPGVGDGGAAVGGVPGANVGGVPGANIGGVPGANVGGVPGANVGGVPGANVGGAPGNIAGGAIGAPGAFLGLPGGGNVLGGGQFGFGGFQPPPPPPGGGQDGGTPGGLPGVMPPFGAPDPNARFLTSIIETRNNSKPMMTPYGIIFKYDHEWGTSNWLLLSPFVPTFAAQFEAKNFWSVFNPEFNKVKGTRNVEEMLHLARKCIAYGKLSAFHRVMEEVARTDPKHVNVKNYQKVQRDLAKPFAKEDPAQRDLIDGWRADKYKYYDSTKGHYRIYAQIVNSDRASERTVERRLAMLEDLMETFYYWFAVQRDNTAIPAMPKYKLISLVAMSKGDLNGLRLRWGNEPMATDGFTPRRDNVIVMPTKVRENDATFTDFARILDDKIREANNKFTEMGIRVTMTKENLLSGKITESKEAGKAAAYIAIAQTAVALWHSLQEDAERHLITHEGVRQLLTASNTFPRNVQTPEWLIVGLATLLETPATAIHPTLGAPSWTHLISFKHFRNSKVLDNPSQVLQSVVTDKYFHEARRLAKIANDRPSEKANIAAKEAWELASCTSWALAYYLSQSNRLEYFFKYGGELDKMPRDLDLPSAIMESCLAKAFEIADARDPRRINRTRFDEFASKWFDVMQGANLDLPKVQGHYERMRAMRSGAPIPGGGVPMIDPGVIPGVPGVVPPNPGNPGGGNPGIVPPNPGNPGIVPPNPGNPGRGNPRPGGS